MTAHFNHTIIASTDAAQMAEFYIELLEAERQPSWGPFQNIGIGGGVLLKFATRQCSSRRSTTHICSMMRTSIGPAR